jgi:hypothetical protein
MRLQGDRYPRTERSHDISEHPQLILSACQDLSAIPESDLFFSRKLHPRGAILATATVLGVAGLGGASAAAMTGTPNGDNGTVKIHRSTTSADDRRNEPKVCAFYLVGFNFDPAQQVSWRILSWPPTGDRTEALHGTLTLDQDGHGRTDDLKLADGHYKLKWNFAGENGRAKHKVFWVDCTPGKPTASPTPTTAPTEAPPGQTPAPAPTPVPSDLPVTG